MGNRNLENFIRKIVKEAPVEDYFGDDFPERMDPKVKAKIEDPEGIYAKNKAFRGGVSDVERLGATRFKEIVSAVRNFYGEERNVTSPEVAGEIQDIQMSAVRETLMLEPLHREPLRDLAVQIAATSRGWLPFGMTIEQAIEKGALIKKRDQGGVRYEFDFINLLTFFGEQRINPNIFKEKPEENTKLPIPPNFSFDVDELTPEEIKQLEIEKRNVINAMIMGGAARSQFSFHNYKAQLDQINPRLYPLYNKIMGANDLMYFTNQDLIDLLGGNAAGAAGKLPSQPQDDKKDDEGGDENDNDTYFANGLIFPILLFELSQAFRLIKARYQWKDMDPEIARQVISQTDTLQNEPMNIRIGGEVMRRLESLLPEEITELFGGEEKKYIPFFEQILYSIPAEEFLKEIIANVISDEESDNEKARKRFDDIYKEAIKLYNKSFSEDDEEEDDILKSLGL
jgi:hypothetical protein